MEEVQRTVKVKLDLNSDAQQSLHQTAEQFNTAVNYTIQNVENDDGYYITSKSQIHDKVYHDLREQTELPANLCVRAYSKAIEMLKSTIEDWKRGNTRPVPEYSQTTIVYDKRTLTINDESATLSTIDGRVTADFNFGQYQKDYLEDDDYEKRMGTLHYDEEADQFYLHIVIQKEVEPVESEINRVLGVDLNLKNVVVTSSGSFYDGGELLWQKNHYFRVRRSLQDKGTRSARQALQRLSGRENRYVLDRLHKISRNVVEEAREYNCTHIAVENLTDIRENMVSYDSRVQRQLHEWAFAKLQSFIEYKAAEFGIVVDNVPPRFTSQSCSKCGHQSSSNRDSSTGWFSCTECGYEVDGDYNAAKNVGMKLVESLLGDQSSSGLGNCHLALKSGMLSSNGEYVAYDSVKESSEGKSTLKPTASAVGR